MWVRPASLTFVTVQRYTPSKFADTVVHHAFD